MAHDQYFSFGDEDLSGLGATGGTGQSAAAAPLVDARSAWGAGGDETRVAARSAERSRGESVLGSSEKRRPSSRRLHFLLAAFGLVALLVLIRVGALLIGGANPVRPETPVGMELAPALERTANGVELSRPEQLQASKPAAAEGQQARQRKEQTRRRARRHRERRDAARSHRGEGRPEQAAAAEATAPTPTPTVPVAPPPPPSSYSTSGSSQSTPEAPPQPAETGGLRDGARSPEFGL